ncbi:MAG: hydroxylamine reductase [Proteobacteria bacterium]|jgi:hydroxylamine reductase|nr:hydroxylamine reductase [Pseudomonadota bacterium]
MFCYQCEQTAKGQGCTNVGVCGKDADTATLQDLLIHATKGVSMYAHRAAALRARDRELDTFVVEALFTTVTNVNFDPERLVAFIGRAGAMRDRAKALYAAACDKTGAKPAALGGPAAFELAATREELVEAGRAVGFEARKGARGDVLTGLEGLCLFGLKGMAAYADHAQILGQTDDAVFAFFHEALDFLARDNDANALTAMALRIGEVNLRVMELLDAANTGAYGHPEPTRVRVTGKRGKALLVSGHDLADFEAILEQTKGKGINVYTHGEMLPANAYPAFKKHPHLAGNYGGAWQNQAKEFDAFPGAVVMTTNCIQRPRDGYKGRIFTTGLVAYPGVAHISNRDFSPAIAAALAAPGFAADEPEQAITVGFGRSAVLGVADKVIDAVKSGAIRRFFLIGGCDGAKPGRNYYTDLAQAVPKDCVILTLACGKYRFNKLDFGDIGGIPRLLDMGQCNDAYSAIKVAVALADAFQTDVNSLPLSIVLSWYEQKAVCVLLTLLHLGIRNIRLGPTLPVFVTPPVLDVLVKGFAIGPTTTVEADLKAMLG